MFTSKTKLNIYYLLAIFSLVAGLCCYLLFRENTYISKIIDSVVDLTDIRSCLGNFGNNFLKFYFPDYLWAVSFCCSLHIIFKPKIRGSLGCTVITAVVGAAFEMLQFYEIINGTGDVLDVGLYVLGALTVNLINLKRGK